MFFQMTSGYSSKLSKKQKLRKRILPIFVYLVYILSTLANLNIRKYQCNYLNFIPKNPDVSTTNTTKTYYGLAGTTFKKRYGVIEVTYKIEKTMEQH